MNGKQHFHDFEIRILRAQHVQNRIVAHQKFYLLIHKSYILIRLQACKFVAITFCMLKRYLLFLLVAMAFVACDKNKLETTPVIEIKNINTTEVLPGQELIITLLYKDKEGDLGGGLITYIRNRLNAKPIPDAASNDKADTVQRILPNFPKTTSGDIELKIDNAFMTEDPFENDTMIFKIFVSDAANNVSDTVVTGTVIDRQN